MPRSRIRVKSPNTRLQRRLEQTALDLAYARKLIEFTDAALKGRGLEAVYNPTPVPHVELIPYEETTNATEAGDGSHGDGELGHAGGDEDSVEPVSPERAELREAGEA